MSMRMLVRTDESGIHAGSTVCAVAGYAATRAQWKLFDVEWRKVLSEYHLDAFHGKVFFNRKKITKRERNPYLGWSDAKANDYFGSLLTVITHRKMVPVGGGVDVPAFDSYPYGEQCALAGYWMKRGRRLSRAPVPYHLAFRMMLVDAADATGGSTELQFTVAAHREYQERAAKAFTDMKRHVPQHDARFSSFSTGEPSDMPALQAADLLVGHWTKGWAAARAGRRQSKADVSLIKLLGRRRLALPFAGKQEMEELLSDMERQFPGMRARLRRIKPEEGWLAESLASSTIPQSPGFLLSGAD
jgi:hypothetical protein